MACELDERLGLSTLIERYLADPRTACNYQFSLPDLFRQSTYSRLAGYEDRNDVERLAEDPRFGRWYRGSRETRASRSPRRSTGSRPTSFAEERNYQGLTRLNTELVQHPAARSLLRRVILDIDSSESPVHGTQGAVRVQRPL